MVPGDPGRRHNWSRTGTADQRGAVQIQGLAPGSYRVVAWEDIEPGAAFDDDLVRRFEARATTVLISEGKLSTVGLTAVSRQDVDRIGLR